MAGAGVRVVGLRELRRDLRRLEDDSAWRPALRNAGYGAATIVATEAKQTATRGATTISGKRASMGAAAIATIRPLAGQTRAQVAGGKASLAYFGGWEFGSNGRYPQFPRARKSGYNIYPAIVRKRDEVIRFYVKALDDVTRAAFPG